MSRKMGESSGLSAWGGGSPARSLVPAPPWQCILTIGMKRILTALILIPLVLLLVFLGPRWLVTLAVTGLAALAAWEYIGMAERAGSNLPRVAILVAIAALFL